MQELEPQPIKHGCFFVRKGYQYFDHAWRNTQAFKETNSPYMLETIDDIDKMMMISDQRLGVRDFRQFRWEFNDYHRTDLSFNEYHFLQNKGNLIMTRLSDCKYILALVYRSCVLIEKPGDFLKYSLSVKEFLLLTVSPRSISRKKILTQSSLISRKEDMFILNGQLLMISIFKEALIS